MLRTVVAYLDLVSCERLIACVKQEELWRIKFNYTFPSYANKELSSYRDALHRPRLFYRKKEISIPVQYIVDKIVVDILDEAYYLHDDDIYHLPITGKLRACVYFERICMDIVLTYLNDAHELRSLTIEEGEVIDLLVRKDIRCASCDYSGLVVVCNNGDVEVFEVEIEDDCSLSYHELLVRDAQRIVSKEWINLNLRMTKTASIVIYDYSLIVVTHEGGRYVFHFTIEWQPKYENDIPCVTFRERNEWYAFRFNAPRYNVHWIEHYKYIATINDARVRVVYPYHVYPLCEKSFSFEKVEYVQGCPLITYDQRMYTPTDFMKVQIGEQPRYYLK